MAHSTPPEDARGRHHGRTRGVIVALSMLAAGIVAPVTAASTAAADTPLTSYVNPFIGTQDDGNTFPGATVPFGMVQLSPDTGHSTGYDYGQGSVKGFSLVHLSGAGCSIGGMVPILPTTGDVTSTDNGGYAEQIAKSGGTKIESASPGYYSVGLNSPDGMITAELSATTRTGVQRYTFPSTTKANVLINPGQALTGVSASSVQIVGDDTVRTTTTISGFCQGTEPFTVFTTTKFARPFDTSASGTWDGGTTHVGSTAASGTRTGAFLRFDTSTDTVVEAQTSLSYVDAAGADGNLAAEATTFAQAKTSSHQAWEDRLELVKVTAATNEQQDRLGAFYSAVYRAFIAPNVGSDVDGRYRGWGTNQQILHADGFTYYQNFSLWDTYRTQQQFLALLAPHEAADMAYSLVRQGIDGGSLPKWSYGPVETNIMTGDPGAVYLVSAWSQGLLRGHEAEAYAVLKQSADQIPDPSTPYNGRSGLDMYISDGFIPYIAWATRKPGDFDLQRAGSATLEYALADAGISTMASALAAQTTDPTQKAIYTADAKRFAARGQSYRNIWDPTTQAFRARTTDGVFVDEGDPALSPGFQEGTAAQYEWMVQQDMPGLISLLGGKKAAAARLDNFFLYDRLLVDPAGTAKDLWVNGTYSYYAQDKYNPNNETDLHAPYAYLWAGQPWKTTDVLRAALTLFKDGPDGVTGNDDLGEMSSWAVMSSIGIYPIVPGSDVWGLSTPMFDAVDLTLDTSFYPSSGGHLHLGATGVSDASHYTQSVTVGGQDLSRGYLSGADLTGAGTIDFTVGSSPSSWATGPDAAPGALAPSARTAASVDKLWTYAPGAVPVPAGDTREVTTKIVTSTATPRTVSGTTTVTAPSEVTASIASHWSATTDGSPVQVTPTLSLTVAAGTPAGTYPVTVTVAAPGLTAVTRTVDVVVPQKTWLAPAFNHTAIGDNLLKNADMDGGGRYYNRAYMADAGLLAGQRHTVPGTDLTFVMGGGTPGVPDNIKLVGQTTDVSLQLSDARHIALVGASAGSTADGDVTLNFTDGTTKVVDVELTDWCSTTSDPSVIRIGKRTERSIGRFETDMIGCGFYASPTITVPDGKTLSSITWPNQPKMHVFAIASDAPAVTVSPATPTGVVGAATVGSTLTVTAPTWASSAGGALDGVTQHVQWSVDGRNVPGATGTSYVVNAKDAGKQIAVTVTGSLTGYLSGSSTSPAVSVPASTGPEQPQPVAVVTSAQVHGTPRVGETLSVTPGTFNPSSAAVSLQWLRDGKAIPGATSTTYRVAAADRTRAISVRVTATAPGRTASVTTARAVIPLAGTITVAKKAKIKKAKKHAKVGKKLKVTKGKYKPKKVKIHYRWFRGHHKIKGKKGKKRVYRVRKADRHKKLHVKVKVKKKGYEKLTYTTKKTHKIR